jgi:hypothetical protein
MSRIINPDGVGKERKRLTRSVVLALRELMQQNEPNDVSRDLAAFIALALAQTFATVDISVSAWEKRGYWVKADRFRMDWEWSDRLGEKMRKAVLIDDWGEIAHLSAQVAQKLMNVEVPIRHRLGEPWIGAWEHLNKKTD